MKFLVACEDTGFVKEIECQNGTDTSKKDATQPSSIRSICNEEGTGISTRVLQMEITGDYLIATRLGATLCVYDINTENYDLVKTYKLEGMDEKDQPISLTEDKQSDVIIVTFASGKMYLINLNNGEFNLDPIEISLPVKKQLSCISLHPTNIGVFACGGKQYDVQIIRMYQDIIPQEVFTSEEARDKFFKPQVIFSARNVKNNHLDLQSPIWVTKILFLDSKTPGSYQFITTTGYGQLRKYDTTHGKRPFKDYKLCDKSIISLSFTNGDQDSIIVTDTVGLVAKYSLNKEDQRAITTHSATAGDVIKPSAKLLGKYTGGNTGAVLDIDVVDNLLATGGLDRYLRVYDLETREVVAKVYVGTQLNSVIVLDPEDEIDQSVDDSKISNKRTIEESEDEEEEIWNQLDKKRKS